MSGLLSNNAGLDLLNSLIDASEDEEQTSEDVCLITGADFRNDKQTLPCNHSFKYAAIFKELTTSLKDRPHLELKCPYCRRCFKDTVLPYRPDLYRGCRVGVNNPVCLSFEKHKCYKEDCITNATIPCPEGYTCYVHYVRPRRRKALVQNVIVDSVSSGCIAILKTGIRAGQHCCAATVTGTSYCRRHSPKAK